MIRISLFLVFVLFTSQLHAQSAAISRQLLPVLNHPDFDHALVGVAVMDMESGKWLFRHNAHRLMMPASNTKLFTTAAALQLLGPDFTFKTGFYHSGIVTDSTLRGDLIIRGSGDPVIGGRFTDDDRTSYFRNWADSLHAAGIARIDGNIIGDDSLMDDIPLGRGWQWDYTTYWYAAEMSALSFNDNCVDAEIIGTEPGAPARILIEPHQTSYVTIINETTTVHPDSARRSDYERPWGSNTIFIRNQVPAGDTIRYSLSVHKPTRYFLHVLREVFEEKGITITGEAVDVGSMLFAPDYDTLRPLFVHESPALRNIVHVINKRSQNLYADLVLKTLAIYHENPLAEPASHRMALRSARKVFAEAQIDTTLLQLADGSGLSRVNLIAPEMTVSLLRFMWHHPDTSIKNAFYVSLPRGNEEESTLRTMFRDGPAAATVAAKTGTIGYARALSGYIRDKNGRMLAFSIMFNHQTVPTGRVNRAIEELLNRLAD